MKQQNPDLAASNLLWFIYRWNRDHGRHPSIIQVSDFRSEFRDALDERIREQLRVLIEDAKWVTRLGADAKMVSVYANCLDGLYDLTEAGLTEALWLESYVAPQIAQQTNTLCREPENRVEETSAQWRLKVAKFLKSVMSGVLSVRAER